MKGEDHIIELLMQSLQNQELMQSDIREIKLRLDSLEGWADRMEERTARMEERFNKVEWRHDDLTLKMEELRYDALQTNKRIDTLTQSVAALTQSLTTLMSLHTQVEVRVRRIERPDDFEAGSAAA